MKAPLNILRRACALLACTGGLSGCVVSTYGPPGTAPEIPLTPQADRAQNTAPPADAGPSEIGANHILISYKGATRAAPYTDRTKEQALLLATEIQELAASGKDFAELARNHSDDPGSAPTGGALGRFTRKQMVPAFSDAAFALPIGGISDVVESPFGYHVIQRVE